MSGARAKTGKRGVELLAEIREAAHTGRVLPVEPTAEVGRAIDEALTSKRSLTETLGLSATWKAALGHLLRTRAGGEAEALRHAELRRYRDSGRFDEDLAAPVKPTGARRVLYDLLVASRGQVPDERTLRRWLSS